MLISIAFADSADFYNVGPNSSYLQIQVIQNRVLSVVESACCSRIAIKLLYCCISAMKLGSGLSVAGTALEFVFSSCT